MKYRSIIIDDERLARRRLKKMLADFPQIEVVGEAVNGDDAIEKIISLQPDVLFLDIQMPGKNGFQVLQALTEIPFIIFVTAYDEFAIRAFEESAIDYLLKPVEKRRLEIAINKLERFGGHTKRFQISLEKLFSKFEEPHLKRLHVKVGNRTLIVKLSQVVYFAASDKYTSVYMSDNQSYLINRSLSNLEAHISPEHFLRVHRSYIVNLNYVQEVQTLSKDKMLLVLNNKSRTKLDIGRKYISSIRHI